ncbi:host cell division inhibitor Icd-like protein [Citrobacter portucalensis]|uniref:host cell division inhibitor Icd-like protein n=1 Tax=Citrobacter portucalensis TaxID=1639133 RepID=UPI00226BA195|nr:host cell division inhibitor Icd-like protein [Citrobacter portucalensis]MCX8984207.1 host cell division inhibitor Icd-like protein [Citrobacter portucalensis]
MAIANSTTSPQPEFTWLFLGTPKDGEWTGKPVTLRTQADTEEEAHANFSEWHLTFAAKIRTDSPLRYTWRDRGFVWTVMGSNARLAFGLSEEVLNG